MMDLSANALLLKASAEQFKDDRGDTVDWLDVTLLIDGTVVQASAKVELLEGLNGSREAFMAGKSGPLPVVVELALRPVDGGGRRFKFKVADMVERGK